MPLPMFKESEVQVLAVAAGKGGVGKSTVSVNLALALKARGHRVGLVDADVYGPSLRRMLPEDRLPEQRGDKIYPALCRGIEMISMAYFRRDDQAAAVRAPIANGLVSQFMEKVVWGELDYLIIDFPPGTGDIQLTLAQKGRVNGALMVSTPQEVSALDVRKAIHLFEQVNIPLVGIVENMSYYEDSTGERIAIFGEGGADRLAQEKGLPMLGKIPLAPAIAQSCDEGTALILSEPNHPVSLIFDQIASRVEAQLTLLEKNTLGLGNFDLQWKDMPQ